MDSKANFVQKRQFEVHVKSHRRGYLGRWWHI